MTRCGWRAGWRRSSRACWLARPVVALWLRGQARERALLLTLGAAAAGTLARRRVPADQPDVFIVSRAAMHSAVFERLQADGPRCP